MSEVLLVIMIALGLSIDAGTVAMAVAIYLGEMTRRRVFRLVFHFGLFQFLMPLIGALLGALASEAIGKWSPVAAGTV
ncbi:MAG: manganese efflux pump, partial [Candidatus Brocadiia bacterium]